MYLSDKLAIALWLAILLCAAALLFADESTADTGALGCKFADVTGEARQPGASSSPFVWKGGTFCWRFVNANGTAVADSPAIIIDSPSVRVTYDHGTNAATAPGVNDAEVKIRDCTSVGLKPAVTPENVCEDTGGAGAAASLTGLEGPASTQNNTIRLGPGIYYVDVVTRACQAGNTCEVVFKAEDSSP